jgi:hypothetical protein
MASIRGLSEEVICNIAAHICDSDLASFRLVSRQSNQCADDTFIAAFFQERTHLDTNFSLNALLSIAQHPALRRRLRYVTILTVDRWTRHSSRERHLMESGDYIASAYASDDAHADTAALAAVASKMVYSYAFANAGRELSNPRPGFAGQSPPGARKIRHHRIADCQAV